MTDEWHKALVLVMRKLGIVEILITSADQESIAAIKEDSELPCAGVWIDEAGTHIRIMTQGELKELQGAQDAPRIVTVN